MQARAIENSLQEKLADAPIGDIEAEIQQKKMLKATAQKMLDCVSHECEPTMEALRTALQVSRETVAVWGLEKTYQMLIAQ